MRLARLAGVAGLAAFFATAGFAAGPAAELRVVAPSAPGSGWDLLAQQLKRALDGPMGAPGVTVVNVPGGGGLVGLGAFAGSTRNDELMVTGLTMVDAAIIGRSPVSLDRLTPIARVASEPYVLVVPAGSPLHALDDLRVALVVGPAKLNWGGGPAGGVDQVGAVLFLRALGLEPGQANYVPFLTSAEAAAATGEEKVHVAFLAASEVANGIAAGRLVALGTATPARQLDGTVPTLAEAGIPLAYANWRGIVARSGLAEADRQKLEALVAEAAASPGWRSFLAGRGWQDAFLGGDAFGAQIRDDQIRVKEALKAAGILKRQPD